MQLPAVMWQCGKHQEKSAKYSCRQGRKILLIFIGPGIAATQEVGRHRSSTLNSHWKNEWLRKAI